VTSQEDVRARRRRLGSAAEKIFNFVEMLTEGSKKKAAQCWPLQTVLLLLCPVSVLCAVVPCECVVCCCAL